jgi:hypothetical protein
MDKHSRYTAASPAAIFNVFAVSDGRDNLSRYFGIALEGLLMRRLAGEEKEKVAWGHATWHLIYL